MVIYDDDDLIIYCCCCFWVQFSQLNEKVADSKARIEELKELIGLMEETRTTLATSMDEVTAMYPEVEEEIDDEIANLEWEKDTQ